MSDLPEKPEPTIDPFPDEGPGGVDASPTDRDLSVPREEKPLVADQPLAAQQDEDVVPDEITKPEEPDTQGPDQSEDPAADEPA